MHHAYLPLVQDSHPVEMALVSQVGGTVTTLAQDERHAYVIVGPRLVVVDLVDPARPFAVGSTGPRGELEGAQRMIAADDRVYVLTQYQLLIFDVSQPDRPTWLSDQNVSQKDRYWYDFRSIAPGRLVLAEAGAVQVWDVSVPDSAHLVGMSAAPGRFVAIAARDDRLYWIGKGESTFDNTDMILATFHILPDAPPALVSQQTHSEKDWYFTDSHVAVIHAGHLFVTALLPHTMAAIVAFDLGTPDAPTVRGTVRAGANSVAFWSEKESLYLATVAEVGSRVTVEEVSFSPNDPTVWQLGKGLLLGPFVGVPNLVGFGRIVVANQTRNALDVWSLAAPANEPAHMVVSVAEVMSDIVPLSPTSVLAVVPESYDRKLPSQVLALDVSDPTSPRLLSQFDLPGVAYMGGFEPTGVGSLGASDGYAYLTMNEKLAVYDFREPTQPHRTALIEGVVNGDPIRDGNRLYVSDNTSIAVLDVTDRAVPRLLGKFKAPFTTNFRASGGQVFAMHTCASDPTWACLVRFDFSDPAKLRQSDELAIAPMGDGSSYLQVGSGRAYVGVYPVKVPSTMSDRLFIVDVSNTRHMRHVETLLLNRGAGSPKPIALSGDRLLVHDSAGLHVVDVSTPTAPRTIAYTPRGFGFAIICGDLVIGAAPNGLWLFRPDWGGDPVKRDRSND